MEYLHPVKQLPAYIGISASIGDTHYPYVYGQQHELQISITSPATSEKNKRQKQTRSPCTSYPAGITDT